MKHIFHVSYTVEFSTDCDYTKKQIADSIKDALDTAWPRLVGLSKQKCVKVRNGSAKANDKLTHEAGAKDV